MSSAGDTRAQRDRTRRAFASQGVTSLVSKLLSVGLGILLARVLFPDDYGVYTLALIVTTLIQLLSNAGFQSYLIQAPTLDRHAIDLCYTLNLGMSCALGAVVGAGAWVWPGLSTELRVVVTLYGLQVALSGLSYIPLALFKRDLDFQVSSRAELGQAVVASAGRVGFALAGLGALSFPFGDLAGTIVRHVYVRHKSSVALHLVWPDRAARPIVWFGVHATSSGMAAFIANQIDKMLLGASYSAVEIGLYGFAALNASLFYSTFIVPQVAVFQAAFSRLREDLPEARRLVLRATRTMFSLALPVHAVLMFETEQVIRAVFGARWVPAELLVQIFAFDFLFRSAVSGLPAIQLSFGLADRAARTKWQNTLVFLVALPVAAVLDASLAGYAVAFVAAHVVAGVHNLFVNGRLIDLGFRTYVANLVAPLAIAGASTGAWYLIQRGLGDRGLWLTLIVGSLAWIVPYVGLTLLFNRGVLTSLASVLPGRAREARDGGDARGAQEGERGAT